MNITDAQLERAAVALFGCFRSRPRLSDAEIDAAWARMDDVTRAVWREAAGFAARAMHGS